MDEQLLTDILTETPRTFTAGSQHLALYQPTLGKQLLTASLVKALAADTDALAANAFAEALRLAEEKREECCQLLAVHTLRKREQVQNAVCVRDRATLLGKELATTDIATLLLVVITQDSTKQLADDLGITREQQRMARVLKAKDTTGTAMFGGMSVYGNIIDRACQRYGWTLDYVLWHISYTNLTLLLADAPQQVYLTDDERRRAGAAAAKASHIDGDNAEQVREFINATQAR